MKNKGASSVTSGLIGVLGGMGPLATVDFLQKLITSTPVARDQDHVPTVVWNVPQIPDRQNALSRSGPSPLPEMIDGIQRLNKAGASRIVIPCNTAHVWYEQLVAASQVPILHLIDETVRALHAKPNTLGIVGIVATQGTIEAGLYQDRLRHYGIDYLVNNKNEMDTLFTPGCYAIKKNMMESGAKLLEKAALALFDKGADHLILACTEVPLGLAYHQSPLLSYSTDPSQILVEACIAHWQTSQEFSG